VLGARQTRPHVELWWASTVIKAAQSTLAPDAPPASTAWVALQTRRSALLHRAATVRREGRTLLGGPVQPAISVKVVPWWQSRVLLQLGAIALCLQCFAKESSVLQALSALAAYHSLLHAVLLQVITVLLAA
jgi:hypothetical protein